MPRFIKAGRVNGRGPRLIGGGAPNVAPVASAVAFTGTETVGETLTGTYTYSDADGDLEGASVLQWYSYTATDGSGETLLGTGTSYVLTGTEEGLYIRYAVTPVAATGETTGTKVFSAYSGAVAAAPVGYALISDQKANGTSGGSYTSGSRQTRDLNTSEIDNIGVTILSNQVTIPAGTYFIRAACVAEISGSGAVARVWLYDATNAVDLIEGVNTNVETQEPCRAMGYFVAATEIDIELQHRITSSGGATALGNASSLSNPEIYSRLELYKVA